jgi:hypothetical protein
VVKTELGTEKTCLKREHDNYMLPAVASCQHIRALHDLVLEGDVAQEDNTSVAKYPYYMVFEWMDHDLRAVPSDKFRENSILPKFIARSVLSTLALLKTQYNAIHTGEWLLFVICQWLRLTRH